MPQISKNDVSLQQQYNELKKEEAKPQNKTELKKEEESKK